jgi:hypothetical protein|tara:strand:+ start:2313 stop:2525 length:213 start_codon:yes stop_codon:yes gene_type:complete
MSQVIKIKRSETTNSVPSTSDLATHEIAMNINDQKIYTKNASGSIVIVASHAEAAGISEADALALAIALG